MLAKCVDHLCIPKRDRDRLPVGDSYIYPGHIARICIYATIYLNTPFSKLVMAIAALYDIGAWYTIGGPASLKVLYSSVISDWVEPFGNGEDIVSIMLSIQNLQAKEFILCGYHPRGSEIGVE